MNSRIVGFGGALGRTPLLRRATSRISGASSGTMSTAGMSGVSRAARAARRSGPRRRDARAAGPVRPAPPRTLRRRPGGWWHGRADWRSRGAICRTGHSGRPSSGRSGSGRSPGGCIGTGARPCPWSSPCRLCRPSAPIRSGRAGRPATGCRPLICRRPRR